MLSRPENIAPIVEGISQVDPASILDVGVGMGKYGVIAREALYARYAEASELHRCDQLHIDGVDLAQHRRAPWLGTVYDCMHTNTDILDYLTRCNEGTQWDLALVIDLLEHWTPSEAAARITALQSRCKRILISTPTEVTMFDHDPYGDPVPGHVTQWTLDELQELLGGGEILSESPSFVVLS